MKRSIPELSIDSRLLYERLKAAKVGETVTYEDLTGIIGRDVQKEAYGNLTTALKLVQREDGLVFGTVIGVGRKRLNDEEIVGTAGDTIARVKSISKKGIRKITSVKNFDALPNDAKIQHNAALSILGVFQEISKPSKVRAVENKVKQSQNKLSLATTLDAFK